MTTETTERETLTTEAIQREAQAVASKLASDVFAAMQRAIAARAPGGYAYDKIVSTNTREQQTIFIDMLMSEYAKEIVPLLRKVMVLETA